MQAPNDADAGDILQHSDHDGELRSPEVYHVAGWNALLDQCENILLVDGAIVVDLDANLVPVRRHAILGQDLW